MIRLKTKLNHTTRDREIISMEPNMERTVYVIDPEFQVEANEIAHM